MSDGRKTGEFDFIGLLSSICENRDRSVVRGIGDDCAVYLTPGGSSQIVTTDAMVEGVHFSFDYFSPEKLGAKLAAVNLSDIAAMGGEPRFAVVSICVPEDVSTERLLKIYKGLSFTLRQHNVDIIGGNTSSSLSGVSLHLTLIGEADKQRVLYRDGAKPGDSVFVTGTLGDSSAGLEILQNCALQNISAQHMRLVEKHISPTARIREGKALSKASLLSSMMDISDGLSSDLTKICDSSRVGAVIFEEFMPVSPELYAYTLSSGESILEYSLHGGEDYELLFTLPASASDKILSLAEREKFKVTYIGTISEKKELVLKSRLGEYLPLEAKGHDHFR